jgi:hypothetical protein
MTEFDPLIEKALRRTIPLRSDLAPAWDDVVVRAQGGEPRTRRFALSPSISPHLRLLRVAVAASLVALVALAAVPIGGASLGSRAINGLSSLWSTTPANQPALDAAANQARKISGSYYTSTVIHDDLDKVEVYLVNAPQSIISELQALHPDIYVIHNHARWSLSKLLKLENSLDLGALRSQGVDIVQVGPTSAGYLRVGVSSDVATAQAKLNEIYGGGIIQVVHAEPASSLMPSGSASH